MYKLLGAATAVATLALTTFSHADTADGDALLGMSWDEIVATAKGGEVNWFMWGGSDTINKYVSETIGGMLKDEYDVTLNRVGISDTVEAVNQVLSETEAGVSDSGSVDMIWINGENFRTMKQGDLAFCGYLDLLPNNKLVDWENAAIANDFGTPVDGCEVPWSTAQFVFAHDTARTENPPRSIPELLEWIEANPGAFTYSAPPDFNGSVFVRHVFYHAAGGVENLLGPFDQAKYDEVGAKTWEILNGIEPYLWREGKTYPNNIQALEQLFANQEVDLYYNYNRGGIGINVDNGTFPETTRTYALTDGTIGNTNYTLIPHNSPNKAAAMVLSNLLLSGEAQYLKKRPDVWGTGAAIDVARTSAEVQEKFASIKPHPSILPDEELAPYALPELQADWIAQIEKGWLENVAQR